MDRADENMAGFIDSKIHLNLEIEKEDKYWEQRARMNWLKEGDENTKFFYNCASQRRRANRVEELEDEHGQITSDKRKMAEMAKKYFENLFTLGGINNTKYILSGIDVRVPEDMNKELTKKFTREKIFSTIKSMEPTKAPGLCTLIYKIISKVVANQFQKRRIGQNGSLTLKLDMSKAYDRVDWLFLEKSLGEAWICGVFCVTN
ncbi:reverse transcriptase [Gossypium australe]|uniref:Reverse transcriptase n=1 Tax=Gossypium australe TaxID=47621 RepID=A0A5B6WSN8_9ROSI|nr:reverse transcriptase [Gossypium australe]